MTAIPALCRVPYYNQADLHNLFARVSASEYVVTATVSKVESFLGRASKEALEEARRKTEAARTAAGGIVYIPDYVSKGIW